MCNVFTIYLFIINRIKSNCGIDENTTLTVCAVNNLLFCFFFVFFTCIQISSEPSHIPVIIMTNIKYYVSTRLVFTQWRCVYLSIICTVIYRINVLSKGVGGHHSHQRPVLSLFKVKCFSKGPDIGQPLLERARELDIKRSFISSLDSELGTRTVAAGLCEISLITLGVVAA